MPTVSELAAKIVAPGRRPTGLLMRRDTLQDLLDEAGFEVPPEAPSFMGLPVAFDDEPGVVITYSTGEPLALS